MAYVALGSFGTALKCGAASLCATLICTLIYHASAVMKARRSLPELYSVMDVSIKRAYACALILLVVLFFCTPEISVSVRGIAVVKQLGLMHYSLMFCQADDPD